MPRHPSGHLGALRSSQVLESVEGGVAVASSLCLGLVLVCGVGVDALSIVVRLEDVLQREKSLSMGYQQ